MSKSESSSTPEAATEADSPALHTIAWTIETERISGEITCHAGPGSECHIACDCEDIYCYCDGKTRKSVDFCNPGEWISNDDSDLIDLYDGKPNVPLMNGPIELVWVGDYWGWKYPDSGTSVAASSVDDSGAS